MKKECVAMLLAGGEGRRLGALTANLAKPAVYFGGKYRIIDFTLSNCTNSGIDTVGVLTQYQPHVLNSYLGIGAPWDLDRKEGGVTVLPPYMKSGVADWYVGTANAIYQNIDFVDRCDPTYLLVISGDHIYKMDYSKMVEFHKEKQSDATIAVIQVRWEETERYGILNTDIDQRIVDFEEKPKLARSNLASMGVYIFNWSILRDMLIKDANAPLSSHDFGKDVIPHLLREDYKLYAYPFEGYWKDVGTIESLWEANMDLIKGTSVLQLNDPSWKIYSMNPSEPPQYISSGAVVFNSLINEGCEVYGDVRDSVLFHGVYIGEGARITESVIMPNTRIGKGAVVHKAIIGENTIVTDGSFIGDDSGEGAVTLVAGIQRVCHREGTAN